MTRDSDTTALLTALGGKVRAIRHARGWTQENLAEAAGIDPQVVQRAESGKVSLSVPRLAMIARALGVPIRELFADTTQDVPAAPWSDDEAQAVAAWRRISPDRRDLALRMLDEMRR